MEPIAITSRPDGEWLIIHRCTHCDVLHSNRIAGDDNALTLFRLAVLPLARPPFRWNTSRRSDHRATRA